MKMGRGLHLGTVASGGAAVGHKKGWLHGASRGARSQGISTPKRALQ